MRSGRAAHQDLVQSMAMKQPDSPLQFEHVPNVRTAHLIESYCRVCGLFIAASTRLELIEAAEKAHACMRSATSGQTGQIDDDACANRCVAKWSNILGGVRGRMRRSTPIAGFRPRGEAEIV